MKITLAESAGFCFGVNRAVKMVYDLLDDNKKVCTLGPIIHNPQLVEELKCRGVRQVDSPSEVCADEVLVIRSHGVPQSMIDECTACGVSIADATCPFVAKIHKIVESESKEGNVVIVAGDPNHSEVKGILGHCVGECYVVGSPEELENLIKAKDFSEKSVVLVSQTTFNAEVFVNIQKIFKKLCTNPKIFDTICNATSIRQNEAAALAAENDAMVVVGGKHSSNTAKLADVCREHCSCVVFAETADQLDLNALRSARSIGVVAGASTPAAIIKEVLETMSEIMQPENEQVEKVEAVQKSFEEMTDEEAFEASLNSLNSDQKVTGVVLAVNDTEVQVDFGRGITGYISASEYSNNPNVNLTEEVKIGDKLELIIMRINDQEGTAQLSKRRFDAIAGWNDIVAASESGAIMEGVVNDVVKGGVVASCNGVRVFIPASLATASRGESLDELKGKKVSFRIIEIGRGRRVIGSIRDVLREERKAIEEKFWANVAVGDTFTGTVKSLTGYGAFVDLGGVDGMIHISELSWTRIKNPSEVVSVGDTVEVYVKDLNVEKKKVSLGYKKPDENPWVIFNNNYAVDSVVKVTIVSMTTYGAFARIIPGVDGLIHISQIANKHVAKPQDELTVGQEVDAKIIAIDDEKKRVSLSIRVLLEDAPAEEAAAEEAVAEEATEETAE